MARNCGQLKGRFPSIVVYPIQLSPLSTAPALQRSLARASRPASVIFTRTISVVLPLGSVTVIFNIFVDKLTKTRTRLADTDFRLALDRCFSALHSRLAFRHQPAPPPRITQLS